MKKIICAALVLLTLVFMIPSCGKTPEYTAVITIKDYGVITVELDAKSAPITVANFVKLAKNGFFDGTTFHRIMANFMMQGGEFRDGVSDRSQDKIKGEFAANGVKNGIEHKRGVISMARIGSPYENVDMKTVPAEYMSMVKETNAEAYNSASSGFFIVHKDSPHLDGKYAAFGYVTSGIEVVDAVCEAAQPIDNNGSIAKDAQPLIESIRIIEK